MPFLKSNAFGSKRLLSVQDTTSIKPMNNKSAGRNCQTCGSHHMENYCPACGEKKFSRHDLTLSHFFHESIESFFHFDNKFFRSLRMLVFSPGSLTADFSEGRRIRLMRPLQLFLVLNILLYILPGNPFALPLENYLKYRPFVDYNTEEVVKEKLKETGLSLNDYSHRFYEKMKSTSKTFIFLFIPLYAIVFLLLFIRTSKTLSEHLVFATHFMSFHLLLVMMSTLLLELPFYLFSKLQYSQLFDAAQASIIIAAMCLYLLFAFRRFYNTTWTWSVISGLLVSSTFFLVVQGYRMFLFYEIVS